MKHAGSRGRTLLEGALWSILVLVVGVLLWAGFQAPVRKEATDEEKEAVNRILMKNVTIEVFGPNMVRTSVLKGREALTFKNNQDFKVTPVRALLHRDRSQNLRIRADQLWKRVAGHDERMDFSGHVEVEGPEQKLLSEALVYHPGTHYLESEAPVRMLTTGTMVLGDKLKSNVDIQTGNLEGNVRIVSVGEPGRELTAPVRLDGDATTFDLVRGSYTVVGRTMVEQGDMRIVGDSIAYRREAGRIHARANVKVTQAELTLTCQDLDYDVETRRGVATGKPEANQTWKPANEKESEARHVLRGLQIAVDLERRILTGKDQVQLERYVTWEDDWELDFRIDADEFTHLSELRRTNFKGNVAIKTPSMGATGERAIFYQSAARLYIIGNARAWDVDVSGNTSNQIYGDKIIHYLRTGKSMLLQGGIGFREDER